MAVRRSRYANFRPEIACALPILIPITASNPTPVEMDQAS